MKISITLKRHQETNDALPGITSLRSWWELQLSTVVFLMVELREDWEQIKLQFAVSENPSHLHAKKAPRT